MEVMQGLRPLYRWVPNLITRQERRVYSFYGFLSVCIFTAVVRGLEEGLLFGHPLRAGFILGISGFYISYGMILTLILSRIGKIPYKRVINAVQVGIFLGVFPPVIDYFATDAELLQKLKYRYFYFWNPSEIPWLFYNPKYHWPIGEATALWGTVLFSAAYMAHKTSNVWRVVIATIAAYGAVLFQGVLLSLIVTSVYLKPLYDLPDLTAQVKIGMKTVGYHMVFWQAFIAFLCYNLLRPQASAQILKRINHMLPFMLIFLTGAAMADHFTPATWVFLVMVFMLCWVTIAQNDYFDRMEDIKSGRAKTLLEREDLTAYNVFCLLGIFAFYNNSMHQTNPALAAEDLAVLPLIPFFIVSILYNYPFYRGKKVFPANLKIEGVWGGTAFLSGVLTTGQKFFTAKLFLITFLVYGGWSLVATLKDIKDIRTDRKAKSGSAYLYFWRKGHRLSQIHQVLSIIVFFCLSVPVAFLAARANWLGAVTLTILGIVPFIKLSYAPTKQSWFQYILATLNIYFFVLILFARDFR